MFQSFSLNIKGRLVEYTHPVVMGIINVTPDSFYCGSRAADTADVVARAGVMLRAGAEILDIGGCSTRPGYVAPEADEELRRVVPAIAAIAEAFPDAVLSVDTYRAEVAREAIAAGAHIINDISAGTIDEAILDAAAELRAPYILTHPSASSLTAATPLEMTTPTVISDMQKTLRRLRLSGVCDIIVDPGFGFGKTLEQNYRLLSDLEAFKALECPILAGMSRKSMITRLLNIDAQSPEALTGTATVNTIALQRGAQILRVHDVAAAAGTVKIWEMCGPAPEGPL